MAVELMMGFNIEDHAVQEAASGLESVEKLIKLLSQQQQQAAATATAKVCSTDFDMDYRAVADVAVSKFKKVISLLGRTRTGHARFRRAPLHPPPTTTTKQNDKIAADTKVYYATPIQQIPPHPYREFSNSMGPTKDTSSTTINFSYSSAGNSFISSLTGETDTKPPPQHHQQQSTSSAFQITNLSQVSSAGKPPLSSSSSLKRKCTSENLGSGKCSGPSGRCHCTKKR